MAVSFSMVCRFLLGFFEWLLWKVINYDKRHPKKAVDYRLRNAVSIMSKLKTIVQLMGIV